MNAVTSMKAGTILGGQRQGGIGAQSEWYENPVSLRMWWWQFCRRRNRGSFTEEEASDEQPILFLGRMGTVHYRDGRRIIRHGPLRLGDCSGQYVDYDPWIRTRCIEDIQENEMTDRHMGYVVVLTKDIREDDAEAVIAALKMIKGVLTVKPITGDMATMVIESRMKNELRDRLYQVIKEL